MEKDVATLISLLNEWKDASPTSSIAADVAGQKRKAEKSAEEEKEKRQRTREEVEEKAIAVFEKFSFEYRISIFERLLLTDWFFGDGINSASVAAARLIGLGDAVWEFLLRRDFTQFLGNYSKYFPEGEPVVLQTLYILNKVLKVLQEESGGRYLKFVSDVVPYEELQLVTQAGSVPNSWMSFVQAAIVQHNAWGYQLQESKDSSIWEPMPTLWFFNHPDAVITLWARNHFSGLRQLVPYSMAQNSSEQEFDYNEGRATYTRNLQEAAIQLLKLDPFKNRFLIEWILRRLNSESRPFKLVYLTQLRLPAFGPTVRNTQKELWMLLAGSRMTDLVKTVVDLILEGYDRSEKIAMFNPCINFILGASRERDVFEELVFFSEVMFGALSNFDVESAASIVKLSKLTLWSDKEYRPRSREESYTNYKPHDLKVFYDRLAKRGNGLIPNATCEEFIRWIFHGLSFMTAITARDVYNSEGTEDSLSRLWQRLVQLGLSKLIFGIGADIERLEVAIKFPSIQDPRIAPLKIRFPGGGHFYALLDELAHSTFPVDIARYFNPTNLLLPAQGQDAETLESAVRLFNMANLVLDNDSKPKAKADALLWILIKMGEHRVPASENNILAATRYTVDKLWKSLVKQRLLDVCVAATDDILKRARADGREMLDFRTAFFVHGKAEDVEKLKKILSILEPANNSTRIVLLGWISELVQFNYDVQTPASNWSTYFDTLSRLLTLIHKMAAYGSKLDPFVVKWILLTAGALRKVVDETSLESLPHRPVVYSENWDILAAGAVPDVLNTVAEDILKQTSSYGEQVYDTRTWSLIAASRGPLKETTRGAVRKILSGTLEHDDAESLKALLRWLQPLVIDRIENEKTVTQNRADVLFPLFIAAVRNNAVSVVEYLLEALSEQAILEQQDQEVSALHTAAFSGSVQVVELLLKHNFSPLTYSTDSEDADALGTLPIHEAAINGSVSILSMLLAADPDHDVDRRSKENDKTPLEYAVLSFEVDAIRYLVSQGADTQQVLSDESTPESLRALIRDVKEEQEEESRMDVSTSPSIPPLAFPGSEESSMSVTSAIRTVGTYYDPKYSNLHNRREQECINDLVNSGPEKVRRLLLHSEDYEYKEEFEKLRKKIHFWVWLLSAHARYHYTDPPYTSESARAKQLESMYLQLTDPKHFNKSQRVGISPEKKEESIPTEKEEDEEDHSSSYNVKDILKDRLLSQDPEFVVQLIADPSVLQDEELVTAFSSLQKEADFWREMLEKHTKSKEDIKLLLYSADALKNRYVALVTKSENAAGSKFISANVSESSDMSRLLSSLKQLQLQQQPSLTNEEVRNLVVSLLVPMNPETVYNMLASANLITGNEGIKNLLMQLNEDPLFWKLLILKTFRRSVKIMPSQSDKKNSARLRLMYRLLLRQREVKELAQKGRQQLQPVGVNMSESYISDLIQDAAQHFEAHSAGSPRSEFEGMNQTQRRQYIKELLKVVVEFLLACEPMEVKDIVENADEHFDELFLQLVHLLCTHPEFWKLLLRKHWNVRETDSNGGVPSEQLVQLLKQEYYSHIQNSHRVGQELSLSQEKEVEMAVQKLKKLADTWADTHAQRSVGADVEMSAASGKEEEGEEGENEDDPSVQEGRNMFSNLPILVQQQILRQLLFSDVPEGRLETVSKYFREVVNEPLTWKGFILEESKDMRSLISDLADIPVLQTVYVLLLVLKAVRARTGEQQLQFSSEEEREVEKVVLVERYMRLIASSSSSKGNAVPPLWPTYVLTALNRELDPGSGIVTAWFAQHEDAAITRWAENRFRDFEILLPPSFKKRPKRVGERERAQAERVDYVRLLLSLALGFLDCNPTVNAHLVQWVFLQLGWKAWKPLRTRDMQDLYGADIRNLLIEVWSKMAAEGLSSVIDVVTQRILKLKSLKDQENKELFDARIDPILLPMQVTEERGEGEKEVAQSMTRILKAAADRNQTESLKSLMKWIMPLGVNTFTSFAAALLAQRQEEDTEVEAVFQPFERTEENEAELRMFINMTHVLGPVFHSAAAANAASALEFLAFSVPFDKDYAEPESGESALHFAASAGANQCIEVLLRSGRSVSMRDREGWTPLHNTSNTSVGGTAVRLLLLADPAHNPDPLNADGRTPLFEAMRSYADETVLALVEAGANAELTDYDGFTPVRYLRRYGRNKKKNDYMVNFLQQQLLRREQRLAQLQAEKERKKRALEDTVSALRESVKRQKLMSEEERRRALRAKAAEERMQRTSTVGDQLSTSGAAKTELHLASLSPGEHVRDLSKVKSKPSIHIGGFEKGSYYTLFLLDPDAPSVRNPVHADWAHWIRVNIQDENVESGSDLLSYKPPDPPTGAGSHRYIFTLRKQNAGKMKVLPLLQKRANFKVEKFVQEQDLGPIVASFTFTAHK